MRKLSLAALYFVRLELELSLATQAKRHYIMIQTLNMCDQGCRSPPAPGCLNGGSCVADDRKQTFSCSCNVPWIGDKCESKLGRKN